MGNGRHDTGQTHSVIQPDDSTEWSSYASIRACGNRLRRLTGLLVFQESRRLRLPHPV